jgi:hypothetical protein
MKPNHLKRKFEALENRIARLESLLDFMREHPSVAARSIVKPLSGGLVGLVVDEKALIRPEGVRKPALRLEIWMNDVLDEEEFSDRIVHGDVRNLSDEELTKMLASIPSEGDEDEDEDEERSVEEVR